MNSLMISALIPAFSNSGATCFKYTSRAWPFLLLGLITTFNLRGLPEMPETKKENRKVCKDLTESLKDFLFVLALQKLP